MLDSQDSDGRQFDGSEDEAFPPLPPPGSPGWRGHPEDGGLLTGADGEADGEASRLADAPNPKRAAVKRPQPKLDSQRLTSDRGLPALRSLFDDVHFKGKGHEAEDLQLLMQKMENWAHRLYPRLQFQDFIEKVERLGSKAEVQTCLKRIRLDMPLLQQDFLDRDDEAAPPLFGDPDAVAAESFVDGVQRAAHSTPAPPPTAGSSLTEEQRRRMELNRQRALERRLARSQTDGRLRTGDASSGDTPISLVLPENGLEAPPTGLDDVTEAPPHPTEDGGAALHADEGDRLVDFSERW